MPTPRRLTIAGRELPAIAGLAERHAERTSRRVRALSSSRCPSWRMRWPTLGSRRGHRVRVRLSCAAGGVRRGDRPSSILRSRFRKRGHYGARFEGGSGRNRALESLFPAGGGAAGGHRATGRACRWRNGGACALRPVTTNGWRARCRETRRGRRMRRRGNTRQGPCRTLCGIRMPWKSRLRVAHYN